MCPSDFSSELMKQFAEPTTHQEFAAKILRRDRRRIRGLSLAIIGFWLVAVLLILSVLLPMWAKVNMLRTLENGTNAATNAAPSEGRVHLTDVELLRDLAAISTIIAAVSTIASLLAAISTVWLVYTVRRATLAQVGAGLREVSEQLRQLQVGKATA